MSVAILPGASVWQVPIETRVGAFTPTKPPPEWDQVADPVRAAVIAAGPLVVADALEAVSVLGKAAVYGVRTSRPGRRRLRVQDWLEADFVEEFIDQGCRGVSKSTRSAYRTRLRRLGAALVGPPGTRIPLSAWTQWRPYGQAETSALWSWVQGQPTALLRHDLALLTALGLGTGVVGGEAAHLRREDVQVLDNGAVLVEAGRPRRSIPSLGEWERELARLVGTIADKSCFLVSPGVGDPCRRGSVIAAVTARAQPAPKTPRLSGTRLRATWLAGLVERRVDLSLIMSGAGLTSLQPLDRILPFVHRPDTVTGDRIMRGN
ncbi:hypothetical protein [Actinomadura sp. NTSP31]|uniref:hypothetical protein n=1 Tax=Actinomadura sp. NTSP31 TaxID=1735447 RepID=UPI0035BF70DD